MGFPFIYLVVFMCIFPVQSYVEMIKVKLRTKSDFQGKFVVK